MHLIFKADVCCLRVKQSNVYSMKILPNSNPSFQMAIGFINAANLFSEG